MDQETLYRYMQHRSTEHERKRIADWLDADPRNRETLDRMSIELETLALLAPDLDRIYDGRIRRRSLRRTLVRWSAAAAAVLVLCAGTWFAANLHVRAKVAGRMLTFQTQQAPVQYTLSDGTCVWLNAGTRLEYPAAFTGRERRVRIAGEALFDVEHDAGHPFIVETFACRIEVLGTRFNVEADEASGTFATALLEGSVQLTSNRTGERLTMRPDDYASLDGGRLRLKSIRNRDDYLWTEGIINLAGLSFPELMKRFEKSFGVKILMQRIPKIHIEQGKIRTSIGIDNALQVLQQFADFRYVHDQQNNTITIR